MFWDLEMGRSWKNFEEHDRKSQDCLKQTVHRNMDKSDSAVSTQKEVKNMVEKNVLFRELIPHREQTDGKNMEYFYSIYPLNLSDFLENF